MNYEYVNRYILEVTSALCPETPVEVAQVSRPPFRGHLNVYSSCKNIVPGTNSKIRSVQSVTTKISYPMQFWKENPTNAVGAIAIAQKNLSENMGP